MALGELYAGYVINPSWELTPQILISPFSVSNMECFDPKKGCDMALGKEYLDKSFGNYKLAHKGRTAIAEVLKHYDLKPDDVVTILTTSGNFYISSCVTKPIEEVCKWSRKIEPQTKIVFVNHEFGYLYPDMKAVADLGYPIIEDCAHTFFTDGDKGDVGKYSDFVIYSLPKAFPMQIGGIITSNKYQLVEDTIETEVNYILSKLSQYIPSFESSIEKRLQVYHFFEEELKSIGIKPFFKLEDGTVPGVFLFRWNENIDYPKLKEFMQANGVESSVFYGEPAFYMPCNQFLTHDQCGYMVALLRYYYEHQND